MIFPLIPARGLLCFVFLLREKRREKVIAPVPSPGVIFLSFFGLKLKYSSLQVIV